MFKREPEYDCCPDCGMMMCAKCKAEHDYRNPPEPLPHRAPTGKNDRCFCGGGFVLVGKSRDVEHYECILCELPIDRQMR